MHALLVLRLYSRISLCPEALTAHRLSGTVARACCRLMGVNYGGNVYIVWTYLHDDSQVEGEGRVPGGDVQGLLKCVLCFS